MSLLKYNKNREAASQSAVTATRHLLIPRVHPMLSTKVDSHEQELDQFKEQLSSFKPKQSALEIGLAKSMDTSRLQKFQSVLSLQKNKYQEKIERKEYEKTVKSQFEREQRVHDQTVIKLKQLEAENDKKLEMSSTVSYGTKMSKKRRQRLERIKADETLTPREKEQLI